MIVLDTSVVLAVLRDEARHGDVDLILETQPCAIPRTCASEVLDLLMRRGADLAAARIDLAELELLVLPFDEDVSDLTAQLAGMTRSTGTSFVDRSCIATGIVHDSLVLTTDRAWHHLEIPEADIRVVR